MTVPVLEVSALSVQLPRGGDRAFAIENVSFTVNQGEIVCVVGESGSGKSVTSQAVMGLLPKGQLAVASGSIRLQGEELLTKTAAELRDLRGTRMAMVFQEPMTALNPVIPVGEQIGEVLEIHTQLSAAERREKVLDIMKAVHLPDVDTMIDSYPHQLSGGQRQRIMIAAALVLDPALLIADEPTTALDVTTQAQILKLIKEMQVRRQTGVLFITHDFGVVADIADRVVVMQKGIVVEQGPARDVLKNPQHPYTKMLIASVPSLNPPARTVEAEKAVALETVNLKKTYGKAGGFLSFGKDRIVHAVKDASLVVRRGETLGIVGESGSGKSTVARCIVRLIEPTSGDVRIDGVDVAALSTAEWRPWRRKVQVVFQDPYRSLNPRRTVGEGIIEGPMNFGIARDEAMTRARDLMQLVGLSSDALDRYPHQFSGGQRQRICIARALAMEPEILIADEAVSALDVSVQAQVLELLEDVQQKFNLAMLFITHDLRVAAQICDRIVVMWKGDIVEQGITSQIYRDPQHDYTRRLLSAAPGRDFAFGSQTAA
ncbi:MAG: ABC transporter ATP-binding protein [Beijerinckiaceae bacterium]